MNFDINKIKLIIWDWNGTLINDSNLSVKSMNSLLVRYNLPQINEDYYKEIFSIPIRPYYEMLGFDFSKHPFEVVGSEYIDIYDKDFPNCKLQKYAMEALAHFRDDGKEQIILSARKQDALKDDISNFSIVDYIKESIGVNNSLGLGKAELAKEFMKRSGFEPAESLLIGDTIHDFEVAQSIGVNCILVSNGHQSAKRLQTTGTIVVDNINEILNRLYPV